MVASSRALSLDKPLGKSTERGKEGKGLHRGLPLGSLRGRPPEQRVDISISRIYICWRVDCVSPRGYTIVHQSSNIVASLLDGNNQPGEYQIWRLLGKKGVVATVGVMLASVQRENIRSRQLMPKMGCYPPNVAGCITGNAQHLDTR
eukprot:scaffold179196_cov14-Tisochrysis_lutea.AAC.1